MIEVKLTFTNRTATDIKHMLCEMHNVEYDKIDLDALMEYHFLKVRADKAKADADEAIRIMNEDTTTTARARTIAEAQSERLASEAQGDTNETR